MYICLGLDFVVVRTSQPRPAPAWARKSGSSSNSSNSSNEMIRMLKEL